MSAGISLRPEADRCTKKRQKKRVFKKAHKLDHKHEEVQAYINKCKRFDASKI